MKPQFNPNHYNYGTGFTPLQWCASAMITLELVKAGKFLVQKDTWEVAKKAVSIAIKTLIVIGTGAMVMGSLRRYYGPALIDPIVIKGAQCAVSGLEISSVLYLFDLVAKSLK